MNQNTYNFPEVSLLITHYNRANSLERLLKAFKDLECDFGDIVVSDDCSKPEHLNRLKELQNDYTFQLITTEINGKLGNNINKGQDKVKTPYTLYVQEDFVPLAAFPEVFKKSLDLIRERPDFDLIRYYAYYPYTSLKPYKDGFSEMIYKPFSLDTSKVYFYSDHPHLRHSDFLQKFGRYQEGLSVDRTEYRMCISLIQKKAKGLFYNDIKGLFDQVNTSTEPSTATRKKLTTGNSLAIRIARNLYRQLKYNFDILFYRP